MDSKIEREGKSVFFLCINDGFDEREKNGIMNGIMECKKSLERQREESVSF